MDPLGPQLGFRSMGQRYMVFPGLSGWLQEGTEQGWWVVITWFGGLLPTNKLANYLLSTKPTSYYQAQQNSRYRTTGLDPTHNSLVAPDKQGPADSGPFRKS